MSISKQELMLIAFTNHLLLKRALGRGAANVNVLDDPLNSPLFKFSITSSIEVSSGRLYISEFFVFSYKVNQQNYKYKL